MNYKYNFTSPEWYRMQGVYFGYPACCIDNFIARSHINFAPHSLHKHQKKVHQNLGFVPCPACAAEVAAGSKTLHDLIRNRFCPEPFPNSGDKDINEKFIERLAADFNKIKLFQLEGE
jgi:hypothetical protein